MSVFRRHEAANLEEPNNYQIREIIGRYGQPDEPLIPDAFEKPPKIETTPSWMLPRQELASAAAVQAELEPQAVMTVPEIWQTVEEIQTETPAEPEALLSESTEQQLPEIISPEATAFSGLKRALPAARQAKAYVRSAREKVSYAYTMANVYMANAKYSVVEFLTSQEHQTNRRLAAGGLLGLAALGATAYIASKTGGNILPKSNTLADHFPKDLGASLSDKHSHIHEAAAQASHAGTQHTQTAADVMPSLPAAPKPSHEHVQYVAQRSGRNIRNLIHINSGDGYTQAIKKLFPNHSGSSYYSAYKAALNHFGPGFLKGEDHYRMANGDYGFAGTGKVRLAKGAYQLLSGMLSSHR